MGELDLVIKDQKRKKYYPGIESPSPPSVTRLKSSSCKAQQNLFSLGTSALANAEAAVAEEGRGKLG